ncbi:hypothetical protein ACQKNT_24590 [Bacillus cereus]|uniref:hypothetical protein n=1 Tax=Bacillus cereus TaxID=1396 RepID=UPI003802BA85
MKNKKFYLMGFEIKVVGTFQRNQQNLAEQPNTFRYKDLIRFDKRVKYAYAAINGLFINENPSLQSYGVRVLTGVSEHDPYIVEGHILGNGQDEANLDVEYIVFAEVED